MGRHLAEIRYLLVIGMYSCEYNVAQVGAFSFINNCKAEVKLPFTTNFYIEHEFLK